jgi:diketogulonate reductase-like aldo/keto reductase
VTGASEASAPPSHSRWIVPIPDTRKLHRLEENIGAAELEPSADELTEIEHAWSKIQVQGGRYKEAAESMTNLWRLSGILTARRP